jgi:hypothetical protein
MEQGGFVVPQHGISIFTCFCIDMNRPGTLEISVFPNADETKFSTCPVLPWSDGIQFTSLAPGRFIVHQPRPVQPDSMFKLYIFCITPQKTCSVSNDAVADAI